MKKKKTDMPLTKKELYQRRLDHWKWLLSKGIKTTFAEVCKFKKPSVKSKGEIDLSHLKVKNSIPLSDRIPGACVKRVLPKPQLPAGKTIGIGYNKGTYQVVDQSDFKTMGRKI